MYTIAVDDPGCLSVSLAVMWLGVETLIVLNGFDVALAKLLVSLL